MALDKKYYVETGRDGILDGPGLDTGAAGVDALVADLRQARRVAIVLHGGLVSKSSALSSAEQLLPRFLEAEVRPVFVVWNSDLLATLRNLLQDVWNEGLYDRLVKKLLSHVAAKVAAEGLLGARDARGLHALPDEIETGREYKKRERNEEPFGHIQTRPDLTPPSKEEDDRLRDDLRSDHRFSSEAEAAARWLEDQAHPAGALSRSALTTIPPKPTKADPELFRDDTLQVFPTDRSRFPGFFSTAKLIRHAILVFHRVIIRFLKGRDHGLYATVVEEVLREFYFTNVGAAVWGTMKRHTRASFEAGTGGQRGGRYLLERLGALPAPEGGPREVSVVGHSAGGIYACHLLRHVHQQRGLTLPADFAFKHLLLMAPACDFRLFDGVCSLDPLPFKSLRLFALKDELESGYWEVPVLYPRSLLYLVSGALEKEGDGESDAFDLPLLGMERYHTLVDAYPMPEVDRVRRLLAAGPARQVWSVSAGGRGLNADSRRHGEFFLGPDGVPTQAMSSVLHVLRAGE